MDGRDVEFYQKDDGRWAAIKDGVSGEGPTKEDANQALFNEIARLAAAPQVAASQKTLDAKAKITSTFNTTVEKLVVRPLKNPTMIEGKEIKWVAFREGNLDVQGYGINETEAKLSLFEKEKTAKPATKSSLDGLSVSE